MEVVILFLMLASVMTRACKKILEDLIAKLSSCWMHVMKLLSFCLLNKWKEKQLGKMSITLHSGWRGTKKGNTSLNLLSMSTNRSLTKLHWYLVRNPSKDKYWLNNEHVLDFMRKWRMWLEGKECAQSCNLPLSFWRWRLIEIRSVIASILNEGKVLKALKIQISALLCILPNIFRG